MVRRSARMARPCVVADEQRHREASGRGPLDHAPRFRADDEVGTAVDRRGRQVEHLAVAVVDDHLGGAAVEGPLDGGIRLADHELHRGGVARVPAPSRLGRGDPGDPFHVHAEIDLHLALSSSGPLRAGWPIQTAPSAKRSDFQIGARAFSSSMA